MITEQNGWGGVSILRNQDLVSARKTNPLFVYKTPLSLFPNKAVPLVVRTEPVEMRGETGAGTQTDLEDALANFFDCLFQSLTTSHTLKVKVAVQYGFSLFEPLAGQADQAQWSYVPLLFLPQGEISVDVGERGGLLVELAKKTVESAEEAAGKRPVSGRYVFDLSVYSSLEPSTEKAALESHTPSSTHQRPILEFKYLFYQIG